MIYEENGEERIEGLSIGRRTEESMQLLMGLGSWDQSEQVALSFLALKTGRTAEIARLILAAASLAQRDIPEAIPRLELLVEEDIESARLRWISSVLDPTLKIPNSIKLMLLLDPVTKRNIHMIHIYSK